MSPAGAEGPIDARDVTTEIRVREIARSKEWHTKLSRKPPDLEPSQGNVEFKIGGAWVTGKRDS